MVTKVTPGQLGMATPFGELKGLTDAELYAELADYASMGVDWIRTDIHWEWVQKTADGGHNWTVYDKVFKAAQSYGIEIVATFSDPPDWVHPTLARNWSQNAFVSFVKEAAEHFGDVVDYWQIINEPNKVVKAPNKKYIEPADYVKMLKGSYEAIKAIDPDDMVISAGLSPIPGTGRYYGSVDYLKAIYANGGKDYFDAVGYHPYNWPVSLDSTATWTGWQIMVRGIRDTMIANGDGDKQVWMTEMGAPSAGKPEVSLALQVETLQKAVKMAQAYEWAGPIMWYSYQDRGGATNYTENWFGLVSPTGQKKQTYYIYKSLALADDENSGSAPLPPGAKAYAIARTGTTEIKDYAAGDLIDLRLLDGNTTLAGDQDLTFVGGARLTKAGQVGIYKDHVNKVTLIKGDLDGDKKSDFKVQIKGLHNLDSSDLVLKSVDAVRPTASSGTQWLTGWTPGTKIDVSAIDANTTRGNDQSFVWIGASDLTRAGQLGVYHDTSGRKTDILMDTNGDRKADLHLMVEGIHTLNATDFIL